MQEIMTIDKPDILYYMLQCLNVMCLYGDAFNTAVKDHQGFFIWCQENLLIKKYVLATLVKVFFTEMIRTCVVSIFSIIYYPLQYMGTLKRRTFAYSTSDCSVIIALCNITLRHRHFLAAGTRRISQF